MLGEDINKKFCEIVKEDEDKYIKDGNRVKKETEDLNLIFQGRSVPTLYNPYFVTEEDLDNFEYITGTMMSIIDKVTDRYLEDEDFRSKFKYPKFIEELIKIDIGYDINVPIGRFDFFYKDRDKFDFIELNTDGASGMNEDNALVEILLETEGAKELKKDYDLGYFELFDTWVDKSLEIFSKYDENNEKPNVAIMDFKESATMGDFNKYKKAYEKRGLNCEIVDPRDVEYRDGKMYYGDYRIDLVYRRIVTFELIDKKDEIEEFLEAYRNQAFCSIGSIRSQIGHNKIFFKILHDEDTLEFLSEEEAEFVRKHVPYTGLFEGSKEVFENVVNNKDKYIMKPVDMNAAQGVFVGRDFDQDVWEKKLKEVWEKDYIYQEFMDPYGREMVKVEDDEIKIADYGIVVGVYLYGKELAGVYNRAGAENLICGVRDYYSVPSVLVSEK